MLVWIEEHETPRLRQLARDWGVRSWSRISRPNLVRQIEAAYRRDVEAEERRAMHERWARRIRDRAA